MQIEKLSIYVDQTGKDLNYNKLMLELTLLIFQCWHKLPKKSSESRFEHYGSQEGTFGDNGTQFGNATDR